MNFLIMLLVVMTSTQAQEDAGKQYFYDRERGWFWFEEPERDVPKENSEKRNQQQTSVNVLPALSAREQLKKQGENWENALANAILYPSKENYLDYLSQTQVIQEQAGRFASGFQQAIWVTPQFDRTLSNPIHPEAIVTHNQNKEQETRELFHRMRKDNALVFFFSSGCSFCHKFAPILKRFSEYYQLDVLPISLDGQGLPEYPTPKRDPNMIKKLNVQHVPAIYLANPKRNKVVAVSYGYTDWSTLTNKLRVAVEAMQKG